MAYIRQRGNSYVVRYYYKDNAGKVQEGWENCQTRKEANSRKKEIEYEIKKGTFIAPTDATMEELLFKWLEFACKKHKWAPKTYQSNRATIQNLICPYIGKMNIQQVNTLCLENLYYTLSCTPCGLYVNGEKQTLTEKQRKRLLCGTTIHDVHRLLKTVFDYAVEWEMVIKNPVPKDAPKKNNGERAIWDQETMRAALESMEDDPLLHLAVHMTWVGSLRAGELLGITPEDIDFEANAGKGLFRINKAMQRMDKAILEKVDQSQILYTFPDKREFSKSSLVLKTTKTESSVREIYMTPRLKRELQAWMKRLEADEKAAAEQYHNSGMLFRLPTGQAVEPTLLRKWFEQWQDKHPEFERIVFHALRHSSATYYLMLSDGDIKAVQGNTGHAQAGTLVNVYAHIQQNSRKKLADKFSAEFYEGEQKAHEEMPVMQNAPELTADVLLRVLQQADPVMKKQVAMALFA